MFKVISIGNKRAKFPIDGKTGNGNQPNMVEILILEREKSKIDKRVIKCVNGLVIARYVRIEFEWVKRVNW